MVALNGIYESHHLNNLESFFILNAAIIILLTRLSSINDVCQSTVTHLLAFLAFLGITRTSSAKGGKDYQHFGTGTQTLP